MGQGLHDPFRVNVAGTRIGAFVARYALPDDIFIAQQLGFHAHADQIDPKARVEVRIYRIDRAGVRARPALPASVDILAARKSRDFVLYIFVAVGDDT